MDENNMKTDIAEETRAIRGAAEMAQKYRILVGAVIALAFGFCVMAGFATYTVVNQQRIVTEAVTQAIKESQETFNDAILEALIAVSEMEVISETTTTTVTQDTGEGSGNNVYLDGDSTTYNESGDN